MIDVIVERFYETPLSDEDVMQLARELDGCLSLYGIEWQQSFLGSNSKDMICHFRAPDLESLRRALRQSGSNFLTSWSSSMHPAGIEEAPTVMVSRRFDEPVKIEDLQAREDAHGGCLKAHNVRFVHSYFSQDKTRMLCLYAAPDAEAVRHAQYQAGMPVESIWAFKHFHP
ncbi:DUF4242 domain-containing protein [Marinobacter sp. F4216]|uniref:DUF4242 domain-containing protein n=1 Tax=Marinobacter sp. F4216 TaxID=2874281 RepID=UPI001CC18F2B|nr:DUF4242 domain-containing protein [Marinobacter sp. F4216]MBZ2168833.1 DUF4242 domain-containing protein [Marinobacter sp. F4216]